MKNRSVLVVVSAVLFVLFTISTTATVIYARSAETTAKQVKEDLRALEITTQNKCIVRMILSYPPPVPNTDLPEILAKYDACIAEQERAIKEKEEKTD